MSSTGRKKDAIWSYFDVVKDKNKKSVTAKCKKCKIIMAGLVLRMKKHIQKCVQSESSQSMSTIYDSESDEELTLDEISKKLKHSRSRNTYPDNVNDTGKFKILIIY